MARVDVTVTPLPGRIALRRNKQTVVTAFAERHGYQSASQTALIELSVNDIVYLQVGIHAQHTSVRV